MPDGPLSDGEIEALFVPLAGSRGWALAISGGADSVALMLAAARWRQLRGTPDVRVLTVDHALRPDSAGEAAQVARWAEALGFPVEVLVRARGAVGSNVQERAREARYALLTRAALDAGLGHVLTAHHQDDQAETVLLRLARGSGLKGLAAMAPLRVLAPGLELARPLLGVAKARLVATCRAAGHSWIDDPSNADERFARARMRALMPALASEGVTAPRLAETARRLARAQAAVDEWVDAVLLAALRTDEAGAATLCLADLLAVPDEVALRALARALAGVGGAPRTPRLERLEALLEALRSGRPVRRTLGRCRIVSDGRLARLAREAPRRNSPAAAKPLAPLTLPGA